MRTTSESGDANTSTAMPAVDMSYWTTPSHAAAYQSVTPLDAFPTPILSSGHHPDFASSIELSSIGFGDNAVAADGTAALMPLPFDNVPVSSELVARPAFHNMTPEQMALWGVLPPAAPSEIDVSGHPALSLTPAEVFSNNGEDEDAASSSAVTDGYSMHRSAASFTQSPFPAARRPPSFSMVAPSPNTFEYMMATRVNNTSISENLLRIYHDVLEHNLTCWITEETCPYNVWARPPKQKPIKALANGPAGNVPTMAVGGRRTWSPMPQYKQQFGPQWSNRVYRRVTRLDKIAQATGIMHLTRAQNQASQRALHLVIMAFATQWAQGSQRQREAYMPTFAATAQHASTEEFDRSIQRTLWQQARQALQDCVDIESYRVVCAELIFSLTQRPWEEYEFVELELNASIAQFGTGNSALPVDETATKDESRRKREAILSKLTEAIGKDGPPIFVERAARKMHALKFRFDNHELGFLGDDMPAKDVTDPTASRSASVSSEDSQTVGLLFWLAVMFDTISASMTERPVVLADDESQHEAAEHDQMFASEKDMQSDDGSSPDSQGRPKKRNNRWRIDLFIQDDPERLSQAQYHYPCSYDEAARTITRTTPVKVLLYRQVLYLQNMLRKPYLAGGEPIEEVISETLMIYRYWNLTYGAFYRELIQHFPTVPSRIRGWFVCILAHWHLGALMLADVTELVDKNSVGIEAARHMRATARTVASIRRSSALQLADLARVATPLMPSASAEPTMPDFHFAVREGTILTEPWTMLLIRAFSKAAIIHINEADDIRQQSSVDLLGHERAACRESLRHCEECIQALWYLGKKSDMARNVAAVLSRAMSV